MPIDFSLYGWLHPFTSDEGYDYADENLEDEEPITKPFAKIEEKKELTTKQRQEIADQDGCRCAYCGEFFRYAEPNQEDGALKCFSCRFSNRLTKVIK